MSSSRSRLPTEIPGRLVGEYNRLSDLLDEWQSDLARTRQVALGGMQAVLVRRLAADVARLVSREPGRRALLSLPPGPAIPADAIRDTLADLAVALAAFQRAHRDRDSPHPDGWLIAKREGRRPYLSPPS